MAHLKVTNHALVQLGKRYALTWNAQQLRDSMEGYRPVFKMSGGEVRAFYVRTLVTFGYVVVANDKVVTVLAEQQAFVDCPRAVFTFLIRQGMMSKAFGLRSYYKSLAIKPQDAPSVVYPRACDTVWCAFNFIMAAKDSY